MPVGGISNNAILVSLDSLVTCLADGEALSLLDGSNSSSNEEAECDDELNRFHIFDLNSYYIEFN